MPVDKRKVTIKTLLIAVAVPLLVYGIEMFIGGQAVQGGVAVAVGVASVGVFVAFQEYDLPYEQEVRDVVKSADITTEDVKDVTGEVADQLEESDTSTTGAEGDAT